MGRVFGQRLNIACFARAADTKPWVSLRPGKGFSDTPTPILSPSWTPSFQFVRQVLRVLLKKHQVLNPVISLYPILMMDNLRGKQIPAKVLFHHKSMFKNVFRVLSAIRMIGRIDRYVSSSVNVSSTLPFRMIFSRLRKRECSGYAMVSQKLFHMALVGPYCSGDCRQRRTFLLHAKHHPSMYQTRCFFPKHGGHVGASKLCMSRL